MDDFATKFPGRFKVYYVLSKVLIVHSIESYRVPRFKISRRLPPHQLMLSYTPIDVSFGYFQPPEGWNGGVGHITKEVIQSHCPPPASDIKVIL